MKSTFSRRALAAAALALAAGLALAHDYQAGALKVGHPWSRATVPGQPTGAAYMKLQNTGSQPDKLLSASTPAAAQVQMHSMSMDGDVMRMREVSVIELPAGQTLELKPGAWHLMLIGLKAPLKAGESVPLTLKFEKAGELKVELKVQGDAPAAAPSAAEHSHQH